MWIQKELEKKKKKSALCFHIFCIVVNNNHRCSDDYTCELPSLILKKTKTKKQKLQNSIAKESALIMVIYYK